MFQFNLMLTLPLVYITYYLRENEELKFSIKINKPYRTPAIILGLFP